MQNIIFTIGDFNGIGPEIILKTLAETNLYEHYYTFCGSLRILQETAECLNLPLPPTHLVELANFQPESGCLNVLNIEFPEANIEFGKITKTAGFMSAHAIEAAVDLAKICKGAIVTAPIQKEALHMAAYLYPGHTEFITDLMAAKDSLMILDGDKIKVALVTTHLPFKNTADAITIEKIVNKGTLLFNSLVHDYGIKRPQITVCALNCHASDGGIFGNEETEIIEPAIRILQQNLPGDFIGPRPSDTAFSPTMLAKTDAYLCMYHDQGLIPLKLLSFGKAVNYTAGLSIIRTSPDHGTAYDIAGKNIADHNSFKLAVEKAILFVNNRANRRYK